MYLSPLKYLFFHHALFIVFGAGGGIWTLTPCGSGFWVHGVCHSTTPALVASLGNAPSSPNLWDSDVHLYPSNFGGVGRIRTYSVIDGRFTVCCGSPTPRLPRLMYLLYNTYSWKSSIIFSKFGAPTRDRTLTKSLEDSYAVHYTIDAYLNHSLFKLILLLSNSQWQFGHNPTKLSKELISATVEDSSKALIGLTWQISTCLS